MARRRRLSARSRKNRSALSALRSRWKKKTRKGGKYSWLGAVVRTNKAGTKIRRGRRVHKKGHSWTGRKGSVVLFKRSTGKRWATNPPRIMAMGKDILVAPIMGLPKNVPALFKGKIVKNVGYAGAGALTGLIGGNTLQGFVMPIASKIPFVASQMSGGMVQRLVGAAFALVSGGVVGRFAIKDAGARNSFITGTAAAVLIEAIFPGRIAAQMSRVPVVGNFFAAHASPVAGIAGLFGTDDLAGIGAYVLARNYQGTNGLGAYVKMPSNPGSMNGLGAYETRRNYEGTNGYVEAPADNVLGDLGYRGERLAGMGNLDGMGSNMASHLDS
jgi:hypothetical protein